MPQPFPIEFVRGAKKCDEQALIRSLAKLLIAADRAKLRPSEDESDASKPARFSDE